MMFIDVLKNDSRTTHLEALIERITIIYLVKERLKGMSSRLIAIRRAVASCPVCLKDTLLAVWPERAP